MTRTESESRGSEPTPEEVNRAPTVSMALVRRAQGGDRGALEELLGRYQDRVARLARIRMGPRVRAFMDSSDVVQETLLTAAEKLDAFEPRSEGAIIQWLARILENRIRNAAAYAKAEKRDPDRVRRFASLAPDDARISAVHPPANEPTPSKVAANDELREAYDRCVSGLPPRYREVILLRGYAGLSWKEIAGHLDRPSEAAARELHRRARIELAQRIEQTLGFTPPAEEEG